MTEEIQPKKKLNTKTHIARLLTALASIYEDENAGVQEKLQAAKLMLDALARRPVVRRKTDKERMIAAALGMKKKTFGGKQEQKKPTPEEVG